MPSPTNHPKCLPVTLQLHSFDICSLLRHMDKLLIRVITRTTETPWTANFFSHIDSDGIKNCIDDRYIMCLPYNDDTAHLIGTTDEWKGGEK